MCLKSRRRSTVQLCRELGHIVVEASPQYEQEPFANATLNIWTANIYKTIEVAASLTGKTLSDKNIEAAIWQCYQYGKELKASDLLDAINTNAMVSRQVGEFFTDYDIFYRQFWQICQQKLVN